MAVAVEVDQPQVGVLPVHVRTEPEGPEGDPVAVVALVEAGDRLAQQHQVLLAVAGQVDDLLAAPAQVRQRGLGGDEPGGGKVRGTGVPGQRRAGQSPGGRRDRIGVKAAQVALVEPALSLLGQDARDALAVQVQPLVLRAVEPYRQILQAFGVDEMDRLVHPGPAVLEFERGERPLGVGLPVALPDIAALRGRGEIGDDGARVVLQVGGADEAGGVAQLLEVVEDQHPPAQSLGSDLETGPKAGEGVGSRCPWPNLAARGGLRLIVLPIVKDDLEEPIVTLEGFLASEVSLQPGFGLEGPVVPVPDVLEIAVGIALAVGQPVPLLRQAGIDVVRILLLVPVDDQVALVVKAGLQQPLEHV